MLTSLLLLVGSAVASDPWTQIDERVHHESLCEAFLDGSTYIFHRRNCTSLGCDEWDYQEATFCSAGVATIESRKMDGQPFSHQELKEADWRRLNGNLLKATADYTQSFGQSFTLDSVEARADGKLRADYTIRSGSSLREKGYWLFGNGPSVPQVVERRALRYGLIKEENLETLVH